MITKRKLFNLTLGLTIAISPLALIAACSSNSTSEIESQKPTTIKKANFLANEFNFNQPIDQSVSLINKQWVFDHKEQIFNNITKLTNVNQIVDLKPTIEEKVIKVSVRLASGAYIDQSGQVATQPSTPFSFTISEFVDQVQPDLPQAIDLEQIANEATFDVANKANIKPSEVQNNQLEWKQATNYQNINFQVLDLIANDITGKLGFKVQFSQKDLINNQKQLLVQPDQNRAISGFKVVAPTPDDQSVLAVEIARLEQNATTIIDVEHLTSNEIIRYTQDSASFKDRLRDLKPEFKYHVISFNVEDQTKNLTIQLWVKYHSASEIVSLSKAIKIVSDDVNVNNPQWARQRELERLNRLIKQSILLKTTFSDQEAQTLSQDSNQVLNYLFNFVSTFGFHYQVQELKFSKPDRQNQAKLSFKIAAKLWRTTETIKPIIISDQFSYDVKIIPSNNNDQNNNQPPTQGNWLIKPSDLVTVDPNDENEPEQQVLTIDLKKDTQLDFANYENADLEQSDQLMMKILEKTKHYFVTTSGDLPADYWNKYVTVSFEEELKNDQDQLIGYKYMFQFEYTNGQNLDDWFNIKATITNGYNSGKAPAKPDANQIWTTLKSQFNDLILNQTIDDDKLHLDQSGNGIMGFAQISADENTTKSTHFSNFLNFSPSEFIHKNQFLIDIKIKNASINYLTNEIKFTWVLEGLNKTNLGIDLSSYRQEFTNQTIKYQPTKQWAEQIPFNDQNSDLQIPNAISLNNILDRFALSNKFVSETILKEKFSQFGANWTWKAREIANYVRFSFYQGFNDGADAINMGIVDIDPTKIGLNENPQNYTIVLKAKLNQKAQGTYLPFFQQFGEGLGSPRSWQSGQILEIRLKVNNVPPTPSVAISANEILPGLAPGNSLGVGQGAQQAYLNSPPRNDLYNIGLGETFLTINVDHQPYISNLKANHRFIALNMLSRYDYSDPIFPEPKPEEGWVN